MGTVRNEVTQPAIKNRFTKRLNKQSVRSSVFGAGKKIIILHGWAYQHTKWVPFVNQLIRSGFDIRLLDIPGLTAPLPKVWKLDDYVSWLHENMQSETEAVTLLGHSNGGRIALAYAAKYPDKISCLVLIDSAGIYHNEPLLQLKRGLFKIAAKIGKKIAPFPIAKKFLYKLARTHDYEQIDPTVRQTMLNLINSDLTSILASMIVPTTIIWGSEDKVTPLKDGHKMSQLIKNSQLFVIDKAKHSPQFTHTQAVVKIITEEINK